MIYTCNVINKKHIKIFAFSLIEVLVVVFVLGLLSAVAIPAYKSYSTKVRIAATVNSAADAAQAQMMSYYAKNGSFVNAYNMGLSTTSVNGYVLSNPTQYGADVYAMHIAASNGGRCGVISIVLPGNTYGLTFTDAYNYAGNSNSLVYMRRIYVDSAGVLRTLCGTPSNAIADYAYLPNSCVYSSGTTPTGPGGRFETASGSICP